MNARLAACTTLIAFAALGGTHMDITDALQNQIDVAYRSGGGTVSVPVAFMVKNVNIVAENVRTTNVDALSMEKGDLSYDDVPESPSWQLESAEQRAKWGLPSLREIGKFDFNGAIERCASTGGGVVTVPSGHHVSNGPIVLKSNVELHLAEGAVVEFSDRLEDYLPGVPVSWEGNECVNVSPLVYAFGCTNVAITGKGVFKPRLGFWRTWYGPRDAEMNAAVNKLKNEWAENDVPIAKRQLWNLPGAKFRPQLLHFNRCRGVRLEGFAAKGTPFWTVHFFLCEDVVARDLDIDAYDDEGNWIGNSDGIDLECTRNALVERCTFHQHDDAIVIKSGKDRDGRRLATPTENVVVRDCTVRGGPTFVAIGSELSGGIRNVTIENCRVTEEIGQLVHVKTNPRRGGFVDGLTVRGIEAGRVRESMVVVDALYFYGCPGEERLANELATKIGNLTFRDIRASEAGRRLKLVGDPSRPVEGMTVENVIAEKCAEPDICRNVSYVTSENNTL